MPVMRYAVALALSVRMSVKSWQAKHGTIAQALYTVSHKTSPCYFLNNLVKMKRF